MFSRTLRHSVVTSVLALAAAGACTNDYDGFTVGTGAAAGSSDSGAAGGSGGAGNAAGGGTGGSGGGVTGGIGGAATGGTGGATGGSGGTGALGPTDGGVEAGADASELDASPDVAIDDSGVTVDAADARVNAADATSPEAGSCASTDMVTDCGACGRACDATGTDQLVCTSGACASSCQIGFANCSMPPAGQDDGCETPASADNANCGGCGSTCGELTCQSSLCKCTSSGSCHFGGPVGAAACTGNGSCSCGGTVCNAGEVCDSGCKCLATGAACTSGQTCCSSGCFNLTNDPNNCGACNRPCAPGQVCSTGQCQ